MLTNTDADGFGATVHAHLFVGVVHMRFDCTFTHVHNVSRGDSGTTFEILAQHIDFCIGQHHADKARNFAHFGLGLR
ncbi:hypothetical protein BHAP_2101 [Bifidobacterium hapali]|uniref:Uncharacterized protein n=1 Tax=Bifidobacterium hapali TaxID=1630172 RepID=A0A261FTY7_9BIFI|nr:hypothetical protein BHAP_2101 [Bifidobacterium hapali]